MSNTILNTFPTSKLEALTMLYLEHHGAETLTPEDFLDQYYTIYERLKAQEKKHKSTRVTTIPNF